MPESSAQTPTVPLAEIVAALSVRVEPTVDETVNVAVRQVTADSRQVRNGALFVAIPGATFDGHEYAAQAIHAGAVAILGTRSRSNLNALGAPLPDDFPYVQVTNARRALAEASAALHGFPSRDMIVIGVTGTDGKTTTCTLLESILTAATRTEADAAGRVGVITTVGARIRKVEQDTGFHVTTPDAPDVQRFLSQMRDAGCTYAIVESTSHGLAQDRVAAVEYDVAAVTNITHEHLDYHGTREAYVQAKSLLYRSLYVGLDKATASRFAVLNADDDGSVFTLRGVLAEETVRFGAALPLRTYGLVETAGETVDVVAEDVDFSPARTRFRLRWWGGAFGVETDLIGQFNVQNILCAATVALGLGVHPEHVRQGIIEMRGVSGRMERIDRGQPFLAVVDFAHSPVSLERALETLRPLVSVEPAGRLISVFGCAGLRDRQKRTLMGRASGRLSDYTVITAEDPRTEDLGAINSAIEVGVREYVDEQRYCIIADRAEAIDFAIQMAGPGDVVAAFGKGHERSMCFGVTEYPWSDQRAMIDALERRSAQETAKAGKT